MLREIRDLGFEYAELSHGIRISLLPGILDAVNAGEMKISTLHNFCPLPMGVNHAAPNVYRFSAEKDSERESALKHTRKTLEFAVRVKARLVVLHMGNIEIKDYTGKLKKMLGAGGKEAPDYQKLAAEAEKVRNAKKGPFMARMYDTLQKFLPEAESLGLKLGVENRESLEEIPLDADFPEFFRKMTSPAVCYWHDTGHAQIKQNLGFIDHAQQLQTLAPRLAGFHIHDVQFPAKDHCPPGSGMVDFASLKPVVKPEHIKVFEFSPGMTPEDARKGVAHVKAIWGEE